MATEVDILPLEPTRQSRLSWLLPIFWQPRRAMTRVLAANNGTWATPLLVLTLAALAAVLVAAPIRQTMAQNAPVEYPPDYQWWTPQQQEMYNEGLQVASGPVFVYVFPALGAVSRIWLGWILLGGILHLVLTLSGSRSSSTTILNIVAWASVPIILRYLVQIGYMLSTHTMVTTPGLVGFGPTGESALVNYANAVLPYIDLYLLWQVALIVVGLRLLPGLTLGKIFSGLLITLVIFLALVALPGFISAQMGGLSVQRPYFF